MEANARAVLYSRVSTDEQARFGYSIPEQKRTLREYAKRENLEVIEEITDEGYSGASLERPGLKRIMELSEAGEIEAAIAIKRDRFFRRQYYRLMYDEDLKALGVRLIALNDTGNKIGDSVLESYAEYERETLMDRSRNGKLSKARAGKIVGGPHVAYGFSKTGDAYIVDEPRMEVVRRILEEAASGKGIRTIRAGLEEDHIPSPGGGERWNRWFIKKTVTSDLYKPHTVEELRELGVSEQVLAGLEPEKSYGVYRYEDIPVPIPECGVDRQTVEAARKESESNKAPSRNDGRFWELSGGIIRCAECGRYMQAHTNKDQYTSYYYYRCSRIHEGPNDRCSNTKKLRAERVEREVRDALQRVFEDTDYVVSKLEEFFQSTRREIGRGVDTEGLIARREELEKSWAKYQRAFDADAISIDDLKSRRAEIESERKEIEAALEAARSQSERLAAVDTAERRAMERISSGYMLITRDGGHSYEPSPQAAREMYRDMGLMVEADSTGDCGLHGRRGCWLLHASLPTAKTSLPESARTRSRGLLHGIRDTQATWVVWKRRLRHASHAGRAADR